MIYLQQELGRAWGKPRLSLALVGSIYQTCGKIMYETGISSVYVVLIEDGEKFLDNKKLQISE